MLIVYASQAEFISEPIDRLRVRYVKSRQVAQIVTSLSAIIDP